MPRADDGGRAATPEEEASWRTSQDADKLRRVRRLVVDAALDCLPGNPCGKVLRALAAEVMDVIDE